MGGADHLLGGLTLHPQRDEHAGDLRGLEPAEHEPLEQMLGIVDRQVLPAEQLGQRVGHRPRGIVGRGRRRSARVSRAVEGRNLVHEVT